MEVPRVVSLQQSAQNTSWMVCFWFGDQMESVEAWCRASLPDDAWMQMGYIFYFGLHGDAMLCYLAFV